MKIGILTFPNSKSYGAALQMFALYKICQDFGYDTEIVNYYNSWMKHNKHMSVGAGKNKVLFYGKQIAQDLIHSYMKFRFMRFENMMQKYPQLPFSDPQKLPSLAKRYGAIICGSDQVWNPDITNKDLSYFLDFCGTYTTRISYAPSFGVEFLPQPYTEAVCRELKEFEFLSVREESGKKLIHELAGLDAKLVVDPTLLMDEKQWRNYERVYSQAKGEYILYYTIRSSRSLWMHCLELAKKTNMKILRIGSNVISKQFLKEDGVEYVCDIGPDQWLYLIHNASYVVTNSFHGTAFSVIYRKNFYLEFSSFTNSRLSNIVSLLGLKDRVLSDGVEITPSATDYSKTEKVLPELKAESMAFLENALKCAVLKQKGQYA